MAIRCAVPLAHSPWLLPRAAKKPAPGIALRRRGCVEARARRERGACFARRRARYEDGGEEEYGFNSEIAMLESYSESARNEAFLVQATVDGEDEMVLIFKNQGGRAGILILPEFKNSIGPIKKCSSSSGSDEVH